MKRILCIGGKGFIGSAYCKEIIKHDLDVIPYDLPECNILDENTLRRKIRQVDIVIHFAAMANVVECLKMQDETFDVNIKGTYEIAKVCSQEYKSLIFISTCCVYGNSIGGGVECEYSTSPQAAEPYACSKVCGEYILRGMPDLKYMILRLGTVYGPGMREALFTYITLDGIRRGKKIYIDGDGTQTRQLIFIDDLIDGICKATKKIDEFPNGQMFNLCGLEKTSALDTLYVSEDIAGKKATWEFREQRYGQTFHENISTQRAYRLLNWFPRTTFREGMKYTYENDQRFR
jgi:nucleoside-diphosphate-sugar epimerase